MLTESAKWPERSPVEMATMIKLIDYAYHLSNSIQCVCISPTVVEATPGNTGEAGRVECGEWVNASDEAY